MRDSGWDQLPPDVRFAGEAPAENESPPWIAIYLNHPLTEKPSCEAEHMAAPTKQPIALAATEANIGAALRQCDQADRLAFGIEHFDAVEVGVAHPPAAPQIAVHVDAEAVGRALRFGGDQDAFVGKPRAVVDYVVDI